MKYYFVSYFVNGQAENFHLIFENFLIIDDAQEILDFIHQHVGSIRIINYKQISKEEFNLNISEDLYQNMIKGFSDEKEFNDES